MEVHLSDILQGSGRSAMGRASDRVDINGLVYVLDIFYEHAADEHMHCAFIVEEYLVWVQASGVVLHVVRDLVKARA